MSDSINNTSRTGRCYLRRGTKLIAGLLAGGLILFYFGNALTEQSEEIQGEVTYIDPKSKTRIRMLLTREMGAREAEVATVEIPAGVETSAHTHGSAEIFYVLNGVLEQTTAGQTSVFKEGSVAYVPPNTETIHKVLSAEGVTLLAIWVPAGEEERYKRNWTRESRQPERP